MEILGAQVADLAGAAWEWGFGDRVSNWQKLGGALAAIGTVVGFAFMGASLSTHDPKLVAAVNKLVTNLQTTAKENRYFGTSKGGELRINIPRKTS